MFDREELRRRPLVSRSGLAEDLSRLGLRAGDLVRLHASVRAIGWVVGGPNMVLQAILHVIGKEGGPARAA